MAMFSKPIADLQRTLKLRLLHEGDVEDATSEPADIWTLSQYPLL